MNQTLNILIVDTEEVENQLIIQSLLKSGLNISFEIMKDIALTNNTLKQNKFDLILFNYRVPNQEGISWIKKIRTAGISTPILVLISPGDEFIALECLRSGAEEYVLKSKINSDCISKCVMNVISNHLEKQKRFEVEKELIASEKKYRELFENSYAIIYTHDIDGIITSVNSSACEFLGYSKPDIVGKSLENFLVKDTDFSFISYLNSLKTYKKVKGVFNIIKSNGDIRHCLYRNILYGENEDEPHVIGFAQDISERIETEKKLKHARDLALESARLKQEFLANTSHEIRTPMNAILGFTALLLKTGLTPEQTNYLNSIYYSAENLLVVINDILDLSKIESGKLTLEPINFKLLDITTFLKEMFRTKVKEKNLELIFNVDNNLPPVFLGDTVRINQILINLLSNAIKFTYKGCIVLNIKLIDNENDKYILSFEVIDTGIGIDEQNLSIIFETFVQAESNTTRKFGGTGLGLPIAKKLAEIMGGQITVKSSVNQGSSFNLILPLMKGDILKCENRSSTNHKDFEFESNNLKGLKILLAEDNILNQQLSKIVLNNFGCEVDVAVNGYNVLDMLNNKSYDLILMDIQMPKLDGMETTKIIRNLNKSYSNIPIIAMTAHALVEEHHQFYNAGMNDCITKPFKEDVLFSILLKFNSTKSTIMTSSEANINMDKSKNNHNNYSFFSPESFLQLADDDKSTQLELMALFNKNCYEFIENINRINPFEHLDIIFKSAHKIKSNFSAAGNLELAENTTLIEKIARTNTDTHLLPDLISDVTKQTELIIKEVESFIIKNQNGNN